MTGHGRGDHGGGNADGTDRALEVKDTRVTKYIGRAQQPRLDRFKNKSNIS